jgi:hypothetical protein
MLSKFEVKRQYVHEMKKLIHFGSLFNVNIFQQSLFSLYIVLESSGSYLNDY